MCCIRVKKHTQRGGAERPAARDLIGGKKAVDLFPRIKSQDAGRSAPLYVCFYPYTASAASLVPPYFSTFPHKWHDFQKEGTEHKTCFDFLYNSNLKQF
jgi:hypothetical protein